MSQLPEQLRGRFTQFFYGVIIPLWVMFFSLYIVGFVFFLLQSDGAVSPLALILLGLVFPTVLGLVLRSLFYDYIETR